MTAADDARKPVQKSKADRKVKPHQRPNKKQKLSDARDRININPSVSRMSDDPTPGEIFDGIRRERTTALSRSDVQLHRDLEKIVAETVKLRSSMKNWYRFCNDEYWIKKKIRPEITERSDALRFALKRSFPNDRREQKNANFYLRALTTLLNEDTPTDQIAKELKKHGLRKLAERSAAERLRKSNVDCDLFEKDAESVRPSERRRKQEGKQPVADLQNDDAVIEGVLIFKPHSKMEAIRIGRPVAIRGIVRSLGPPFKVEFHSWELDPSLL